MSIPAAAWESSVVLIFAKPKIMDIEQESCLAQDVLVL